MWCASTRSSEGLPRRIMTHNASPRRAPWNDVIETRSTTPGVATISPNALEGKAGQPPRNSPWTRSTVSLQRGGCRFHRADSEQVTPVMARTD